MYMKKRDSIVSLLVLLELSWNKFSNYGEACLGLLLN